MESCKTSKEIIKEFCKNNMSTHTDWTGTYVEYMPKCESVDVFVERLWEYIEDNYYRL